MTYGYRKFTYTLHEYECHGHLGFLMISSIVLFQSGIILQHLYLMIQKNKNCMQNFGFI